MTPMKSEINSLLKLLNDDSRFVSEAAAERLYKIIDNPEAYKKLMEATESENLTLQLRAQRILNRHRFANYQELFQNFSRQEQIDLEEGCKLIAAEDYHMEEVEAISTSLDQFADELRPEFQEIGDDDPLKAKTLIKFLFETKGFVGNRDNYFSLDNSFLNCVLTEKKGIPLTLGILMILLAKRLDFTLHPISVPTNFLVHFGDDFDINYLDPFNKGQSLTRQECFDFLKRVGVVPHPLYLEPATTRQVLARMLRNLAAIYHQSQAHQHAAILEDRIKWLTGGTSAPDS